MIFVLILEKQPIWALYSYIKWSDWTISECEYKTCTGEFYDNKTWSQCWFLLGLSKISFLFCFVWPCICTVIYFFIWMIPLLKFSSDLCSVSSSLVPWQTKMHSTHYQNIVFIYFKLLQLKKLNNTVWNSKFKYNFYILAYQNLVYAHCNFFIAN